MLTSVWVSISAYFEGCSGAPPESANHTPKESVATSSGASLPLLLAELAELASQVPQPAAAVVSTDEKFITFLKLRLEYVAVGRFEAPSPSIPDPLSGSV